MKRLLALMLCLIMTVSMFPAAGFAQGTVEEIIVDETAVEEVTEEEPAEEPAEGSDEDSIEEPVEEEVTEEAPPEADCVHTYESAVTLPTCTEAGYTQYTCALCGDSYTADESEALGHSWNEGEVIAEATCTEAGAVLYTCGVCGVSEQSEVAANGHVPVIDEAVAPTETATGLTEGSHCGVCGEVLVAQLEIPAALTEEEMALTPPANACGVEVVWELDEASGILTITGNRDMYDYDDPDLAGADKAPWYDKRDKIKEIHVGNNVTSIGTFAFADTVNLTRVEMPDTMQYIGEGSFRNSGITNITITEGVVNVSPKAFYGSKLTDIHVDGNNTKYYDKAGVLLSKDAKTLVYYPSGRTAPSYRILDKIDSVTVIGEYAFYAAQNLTSVDITGVTTINKGAFAECNNLKSIDLPKSVSNVKALAFAEWDALETITVNKDNYEYRAQDNVLYSKDGTTIVWYPCGRTGSFTIPEVEITEAEEETYVGVTTIAEYAFGGSKLNTLVVPESVTDVMNYAFKDSDITELYFDGNQPRFASYAFEGIAKGAAQVYARYWSRNTWNVKNNPQYGAEEIAVDTPAIIWELIDKESTQYCGENAVWNYYGATKTLIISGEGPMYDYASAAEVPWAGMDIENVYVEKTITSIGAYAFFGFGSLKNVVLPERGKTNTTAFVIGDYAFAGCSGIGSIALPRHLVSIGRGAFSGCTGITKVTIHKRVAEIGAAAFENCIALESINIPASVKTIGDSAFSGCVKLKTVTMPSDSSGSVLESIGHYAFYGCAVLEEMVFPSDLTRIGEYAFFGCKAIKTVTIPSKVVDVFEKDENGKDKVDAYGNKIIKYYGIGAHAFEGCEALTEVTVKGTASKTKTITEGLFAGCIELATVKLSTGVVEIQQNAFKDCIKLSSITVPNTVTTLAPGVFAGLPEMKTAGNSVSNYYFQWTQQIPANAFYGMESLISIEMPIGLKPVMEIIDGVEQEKTPAIGENAFYGCTGITEIDIPYQVNNIYDRFDTCTGLTAFNVPSNSKTYKSVDGVLFSKDGTRLVRYPASKEGSEYVVPDTVTTIGTRAFYNNKNLTCVTFQDGIEAIEENVFAENAALNEIRFTGKAPKTIAEYAFTDVDARAYYVSAMNWSPEPTDTYGADNLIWVKVSYVLELDEPEIAELVSGQTMSVDCRIRPMNIEAGAAPEVSLRAEDKKYADIKLEWNSEKNTGVIKLTARDVDVPKDVVVTLGSSDPTVHNISFGVTIIPKVDKIEIWWERGGDNRDELEKIAETGRAERTVIVDKTDGLEFILTANAIPDTAVQDVIWSSSNSSIAAITENEDGTATVKLKDLGEVAITAKSEEKNSRISTSVILDVIFLDKGEELTAELDGPEYGLPSGATAQINVYGEDKDKPLGKHKFDYVVSDKSVATVDENGLVTAGDRPDTITVYISPKETDPYERTTTLKVKVIPTQITDITLVPAVDYEYKHIVKYRDEDGDPCEAADAHSYVIELDRSDHFLKGGFKIQVDPILINAKGVDVEPTTKNISYATSNSAIATVAMNKDGSCTVTVKENADGACTIAGISTDEAKTEGYMSIYVRDYAPKFDTKRMDINPYYTPGVSAKLLPSYDNQVESVALYQYNKETKEYDIPLAEYFDVSYDPALEEVSVRPKAKAEELNKQTLKVQLAADCSRPGDPYRLDLTIVVKASLPSVNVKHIEFAKDKKGEYIVDKGAYKTESKKLDLFYRYEKIAVAWDADGNPTEYDYIDNAVKLNITASGAVIDSSDANNVELVDTADFTLVQVNCLDGETRWAVKATDGYFARAAANSKYKPDTKGTLLVWCDGYNRPVEKALTVSTTKSSIKLVSNPTASTVNTAIGLTEAQFEVYQSTDKKKENALKLSGDTATNEVAAEVTGRDVFSGNVIVSNETVKLNAAVLSKTATAKVAVKMHEWAVPVEVSHKINLQTAEPVAKIALSTVKINRNFPGQAAESAVTLNNNNVSIKDILFVATGKEAAVIEANKMQLKYADGKVIASIIDKAKLPAKGTYTYVGSVMVDDDTADGYKLSKTVTLKVNVMETLPTVSFGTNTIKLNTKIAEKGEIGRSIVKLSAKDEETYDVVGFKELAAWDNKFVNLNFVPSADPDVPGDLYVNLKPLDPNFKDDYASSYTLSLTPLVAYEGDPSNPAEAKPIRLTVRTYSSKDWKATVSAKGDLDVTQRDKEDNRIAYTITNVSNVIGTVDSVTLAGKNKDKFTLEVNLETGGTLWWNDKGQPVVYLRLKDGDSYYTDKTYTVQLDVKMKDMIHDDIFKVSSDLLNVKVKQTPLKVKVQTVRGSIYQSQSMIVPASYSLTMTSPEMGRIEKVELDTENTASYVLNAIGRTIKYVDGERIVEWNNVIWQPDSDGRSGTILVKLKDTSKLVGGKSYVINMNVTPAGNAENIDPIPIRLSIKIAK